MDERAGSTTGPGAEPAAETTGPSEPAPDPIRILIAEDQALLRASFAALMNAEPDLAVVGQAVDGAEAVALAAGVRPDVVVMDIQMPGLSGIEATRRICADSALAGTRVLVLTMFEVEEYVLGALRAGASGFLLKDTRSAELHQAIRAVAAGDAILTPRITRQMLNQHMTRRAVTPEQRDARQRLGALSPREREVAGLVAQGLTNAEIAGRLFIQPDSVKKSVTRILGKLGLRDRVQLVIILRDAPDAPV